MLRRIVDLWMSLFSPKICWEWMQKLNYVSSIICQTWPHNWKFVKCSASHSPYSTLLMSCRQQKCCGERTYKVMIWQALRWALFRLCNSCRKSYMLEDSGSQVLNSTRNFPGLVLMFTRISLGWNPHGCGAADGGWSCSRSCLQHLCGALE